MSDKATQELEKKAAGEAAAALVADGMVLGIGTGSTVTHFIDALGERVRGGMAIRGVPTSERTAAHCHGRGIEVLDFSAVDSLDLAVDGADEIDMDFQMIKGGGGALLREKVVAAAARHVAIIVDSSKRVEKLGAFPLPVEVVRFGHQQTERRLRDLGIRFDLRLSGPDPYVTDNGNYILDCHMDRIADPAALHGTLKAVTGVVDTGLFIDLCHTLIVGENGRAVTFRKSG